MNASDKTISLILKDLTNLNENLLALSDDIWNSIDHNDQEQLDEGYQFKTEFNRLLNNFEANSTEISTLISQFTGVKAEKELAPVSEDSEENKRLIKELDTEEPHKLTEDFTYKQPYAFTFKGCAYIDRDSWSEMYITLAKCLYKMDPQIFYDIADNPKYYTKKGKNLYSRTLQGIEKVDRARQIADDLYVATLFSSNQIAKRMIEILSYYNYDSNSVTVYLRKDRNA